MSSFRRPYVYCHTCHAEMAVPGAPIPEMVVSTPDEVHAACQETPDSTKLLRCVNPGCFAPKRAIIMSRNLEAELVAQAGPVGRL